MAPKFSLTVVRSFCFHFLCPRSSSSCWPDRPAALSQRRPHTLHHIEPWNPQSSAEKLGSGTILGPCTWRNFHAPKSGCTILRSCDWLDSLPACLPENVLHQAVIRVWHNASQPSKFTNGTTLRNSESSIEFEASEHQLIGNFPHFKETARYLTYTSTFKACRIWAHRTPIVFHSFPPSPLGKNCHRACN